MPQTDLNDIFFDAEQLGTHHPLPEQLGQRLVLALHRAFKGAGIYERKHPTYLHLIRELLRGIHDIHQEAGILELRMLRDTCFCNGAVVRVTADAFPHSREFVTCMQRLCIGELRFQGTVSEFDLAECIALLHRLPVLRIDNAEIVMRRLEEKGITTCEVSADTRDDLALMDGPEALKKRAKKLYFYSLGLAKEMLDDARRQTLNLGCGCAEKSSNDRATEGMLR
jgi:hypothetical protein